MWGRNLLKVSPALVRPPKRPTNLAVTLFVAPVRPSPPERNSVTWIPALEHLSSTTVRNIFMSSQNAHPSPRSPEGELRKGVSGKGERTNLEPSSPPDAENVRHEVSSSIVGDRFVNRRENQLRQLAQPRRLRKEEIARLQTRRWTRRQKNLRDNVDCSSGGF